MLKCLGRGEIRGLFAIAHALKIWDAAVTTRRFRAATARSLERKGLIVSIGPVEVCGLDGDLQNRSRTGWVLTDAGRATLAAIGSEDK